MRTGLFVRKNHCRLGSLSHVCDEEGFVRGGEAVVTKDSMEAGGQREKRRCTTVMERRSVFVGHLPGVPLAMPHSVGKQQQSLSRRVSTALLNEKLLANGETLCVSGRQGEGGIKV